ncbi:MAG TPA: hypothetical protein VGJ44_28285 [Kribbellaceae bacterium]
MSQQYGPPQGPGPAGPYGQRPAVGPPPAAQPWGPPAQHGGAPFQSPYGGPAGQGPLGMPLGYRPPRKSNTPRLVAIAGGALALLLILGGAVLLVTRGDDTDVAAGPGPQGTRPTDPRPTDLPTDQPTASVSPSPTRTYVPKPGQVEVGHGVYLTPAKGWVRDTTYKNNGANYTLPRPGGSVQGWMWARQTELYDAKGFAEHLADVESNNLQHVTMAHGRYIPCRRPVLVKCYAINFSAVVPASQTKTHKPIVFRGLIQAFQRKDGLVTASDAALRNEVFKRYYPQIQQMIISMWDSM